MVSSGEIAGCCSGWKMLTRLNKYIRLKFFTRYLRLRTDWQLVYNYRIPIPHYEAVKLFLAALFISFLISLLIALFLVLIAALFTALFVTLFIAFLIALFAAFFALISVSYLRVVGKIFFPIDGVWPWEIPLRSPAYQAHDLTQENGLDVLWEILAVEWNIFTFAELDLPLVKLMFLAPDIVSHREESAEDAIFIGGAALPRTRSRNRTQRKTWEVLDW